MNNHIINTLALTCYYNQNFFSGEDGVDRLPTEQEAYTTSFAVACFLAQNTKLGDAGVEPDIVLKMLTETRLDKDNWFKYIEHLFLYFDEKLSWYDAKKVLDI